MKTLLHILALTTILFSVSAVNGQENSAPLKDPEGHVYPVKVMPDGKKWMTANLKSAVPGSYPYENTTPANPAYGRLYTWASAQEGCKALGAGWHLPTNEEWQKMASGYGGVRGDSKDGGQSAYKALMEGGDASFDAVYGGGRNADGSYERVDAHGFYWTATESDAGHAWFYNFGRNGKILNRHPDGEKQEAFSVRCVSDK